MKIAILGTRGIPNNYGGFEQFAEYLSDYLFKKNHEVYVYNAHNHPFQGKKFNGINLIHKFDPESRIGTVGQFIYDFNCILDSRNRNFEIILQLGYTSSSIWAWILPKKSVIVTNMDGLEWKRTKYLKPIRWFLKYAEKLAVKTSDFLIADSIGIQAYLKEKYNINSKYIAYGAKVFEHPNEAILEEYDVKKNQYNLLIARLEPENNIETILEGITNCKSNLPFLVIGKHDTSLGNYLKEKFRNTIYIRFLGGIYNQNHLNNLRYFSNLYFHGHSVGGTNPSLLEAMASSALVIANNNTFNKSILGNDAFYFNNSDDISRLSTNVKSDHLQMVQNNIVKITTIYEWDLINNQYEKFLQECLKD